MHVAEIWRYPVKSMAGESLREADVLSDGIAGDRGVIVVDGRDRLVTARTHPKLLGLRATIGADGEPWVDGRPWNHPDVERAVEAAAGRGSRLLRWDGPERFDVLPLLVATDGAIAAFGRDSRRLRPNLVIAGVEGLAERGWERAELQAGSVRIAVQDLRGRCVMTTYDPDTQAQDPSVLRDIARHFGGRLALNCAVLEPGTLRLGDPVEVNRAAR
ncbi:MAG: MOSC domain-containing protein [Myxococcales bacterium]|nr:MOSC N-terminal beta barrel domain-containing protein [Myxococcales bacterium]